MKPIRPDGPVPLTAEDHEILPQPGTARTAKGALADLTNPLDYPVTAVCQCGRPIGCDRWLHSAWYYTEGGEDMAYCACVGEHKKDCPNNKPGGLPPLKP